MTIVSLWASRNFVITMTLWQVALYCTKRVVRGVHIGRSISSSNCRCFFFLIVIFGGGRRDPPLLIPSRCLRASMPCTLSPLIVAKTSRWGVPLLSLLPSSRPDHLVLPHSLNLKSESANGGEMHPKPVGHPLDPLAHLQSGQGFGLILYAHPTIVLNYVCLKNIWSIFENVALNPYNISIFIKNKCFKNKN